jgi:hypothetical protein
MKVEKFEEKSCCVCDKCNKEILIEKDGASDFKFRYNTGWSSFDEGSGIIYEVNLCKDYSKKLVKSLSPNKFNMNKIEQKRKIGFWC